MNNIIEYISENAKNKKLDPIKKLYEYMNDTDINNSSIIYNSQIDNILIKMIILYVMNILIQVSLVMQLLHL